MSKFTIVKVNVNGTQRQFKLEDGLCIQDMSQNRYLLKDGKWFKTTKYDPWYESVRGFMGFGNVPPKLNMSESQMQCIEALMDNDGEDGLSADDIAIGQDQFLNKQLGVDFAKHLTDNVKVKPARYIDGFGISPDCISVGLSNGNKVYVDKESYNKDRKDISIRPWNEEGHTARDLLCVLGALALGALALHKGLPIVKKLLK